MNTEEIKNWIGDQNSVFKTLGASNHTDSEREVHDYYATDPKACKLLLELESFHNILEPACGEGHISKVLIDSGVNVISSDVVDRGYGVRKDFFSYNEWNGDIITNPPYKYALSFVKHALDIIPEGNKVAMFLKLQFLEGKKRKEFFMYNPFRTLYVSSSRLLCAKNGDFSGGNSSAVAYGWFVWVKGFKGRPEIAWFN